jgi:hypothetical protein
MRRSAITAAARERTEQAADKLRQVELEQRATEVAERLRQSELAAKAQAAAAGLQGRGAELAAKAQPKVSELTSKAQATAADLAAKAQPKVEELTAKAQATAADLAAKAQPKVSEVTARGSELAEERLRRVGERLATGRPGELLGIEPARPRRTWLWLLAGLAGIAVGYALGVMMGARRSEDISQAFDEGRRAAPPLADAIRAQLTNDPRTAGLPDLQVNVADGTVFVRGTVPSDFDEEALREVIERVPGVEDVDLQVRSGA